MASVLKEEIQRLARKEVRSAADPLKKQVLELRRRLRSAEQTIAKLQRSTKKAVAVVADQMGAIVPDPDDADEGRQIRISPDSVRKHRDRLGLTQAEMALLMGVTPATVLRWESGQSRPRGMGRQAFASVRAMGVREVRQRLEQLGG